MLRVLSVGYPLAPVSPDSAGGAEQILAALDRALVKAGHRSIVIAPEGSVVAGELHRVPSRSGELDDAAKAAAQADTRAAIAAVLDREPIDIVHLHGIDFDAYLPPPGPPALVTLHLPPDWYSAEALRPSRPKTFLHAVSEEQHRRCPASPALLPPIPNGVAVEALHARHAKRDFALHLGRICPEKGTHLAIRAARSATIPLVIAGQVYPYAAHRRYFAERIAPHLGPGCRFAGPVDFRRKRRLMTAARCLLVPSLAAETSSLVIREAAACGTAAIAFPNGAIAEAIEEGQTGFLVEDAEAMARAIPRCATIEAEVCRAVAAARFSDAPMIAAYLARYAHLAAGRAA